MDECTYSTVNILVIGYQNDTLSLLHTTISKLMRPASFQISQVLVEDFEKPFLRTDIDLIILELLKSKTNPFLVAQEIRSGNPETPLVFFSEDEDQELVFQSFTYHPYAYLRKGKLKCDLRRVLQMYLEERFYPSKRGATIVLRSKGENVHIPLGSIQYIETKNGKSTFYTDNGEHETKESLKRFSDVLCKYDFLLTNRNVLINMAKIDKIDRKKQKVKLSGRRIFSVSRRQMPKLIKGYHNCRYWQDPKCMIDATEKTGD